jgi:hypothetical protein
LHDFIVNDSDGAGNNWNYDNEYNVDSCRFRAQESEVLSIIRYRGTSKIAGQL